VDRRPLPTALLAAGSLLLCGLLGACTDDTREAQESTGTPTMSPAAPVFTVEANTPRAQSCYDLRSADLGSIDYSWRSSGTVSVTDVQLIDAEGVELRQPVQTVPPVNGGGQIPVGGEFLWKFPGKQITGNRFIVWGEREPVDAHVFGDGETGLFLLHLRYLPGRGSSHGLRVTYTLEGDDLERTAEVTNDLRWDVTSKRRCSATAS
jgi:hypothetical protein